MSRPIESGSETTFDLVTRFTLAGLMLRIEVFRLCLLDEELPHFDTAAHGDGAVDLAKGWSSASGAESNGTTPLTLCPFSFPMPQLPSFDSAPSKMEKVNAVYS